MIHTYAWRQRLTETVAVPGEGSPLMMGPRPNPDFVRVDQTPQTPENFQPQHFSTPQVFERKLDGRVTITRRNGDFTPRPASDAIEPVRVLRCAITCRPARHH